MRCSRQSLGENDLNSLKFFSVIFTSPVKPGDSLETSIWEVGRGLNGAVELTFQMKDLTDNIVLGSGVAYMFTDLRLTI